MDLKSKTPVRFKHGGFEDSNLELVVKHDVKRAPVGTVRNSS